MYIASRRHQTRGHPLAEATDTPDPLFCFNIFFFLDKLSYVFNREFLFLALTVPENSSKTAGNSKKVKEALT